LTGVVDVSRQWLQAGSLEARLFKEDTPNSPVFVKSLLPTNFFEFSSLVKGRYFIRLVSALSPQMYSINASEQAIDLFSPVTHIHMSFTATLRDREVNELTSTPLFSLAFGVVIIIAIFNHAALIQLYQSLLKGKDGSVIEQSWLPKDLQKKVGSKKYK